MKYVLTCGENMIIGVNKFKFKFIKLKKNVLLIPLNLYHTLIFNMKKVQKTISYSENFG